ncbi:unnamed protein product [Cylicostephanus goldi]|uniref:Uncharacterized protein n=1 Tax=Cylicostephanus goldi TaxID=71465 RepID=A0A3P6T3F4_CYLGO|nr:unnamed protein product [Cylicostephanus goldi]
MELFRRLQNYYDAMKYLRNQNISWNTITVAEVDDVFALGTQGHRRQVRRALRFVTYESTNRC